MTPDTEPRVHAGRPRIRHLIRIPLLAVGMAVAAALIAAPGLIENPESARPNLAWCALLPLFALAEVVVIHLPTRRNAHGHTLREIPAVLGLTFLTPQQYLSAYVVGAVVALLVAARMRGEKLAFNAAMFALEAALGAFTYQLILQGGDPLSLLGWLAVLVAVLVTDLISAAAVTTAISLSEGSYDGEVLHEVLQSGLVAAFINTCVALLVATLVIVQPSALPLLGVLVILLVMTYRSYVALARGHARTQLLYRFVDRTSSAHSLEEVVEAVLREAADLMHAEHAHLVEVLDDRQLRHHVVHDDSLHTELLLLEHDVTAWWWDSVSTGGVTHERPHPKTGDAPAPTTRTSLMSDPRDGLAAPLQWSGSTRYVLVVSNRSFEKETFGAEDVKVFEALATHAGVAVDRARGVSELEELAEALEGARDAALAASEAKSMFLANMSHEIRTPLTTVLAAAELLEDAPLDDAQLKLLGRMHRSGEVLLALVENVLDFSRIEARRTVLQPAELDLPALVRDVGEANQTSARKSGIELDWSVDPLLPRVVTGDRTRIVQVLNNLVTNALKFTPEGRVHLDVQADPGGGSAIQFAVSDSGIGIDAHDLKSIFEVFSQADGSLTRHYDGTGLGLAICKQLTELMGGTLSVVSQPGVGSTFTVRLPLLTTDVVSAATVRGGDDGR